MFEAAINFIKDILDFIVNVKHTDTVGFYLYWVPAGVCLLGYFFDCAEEYRKDLAAHTKDYYTPQLTVGKIVARLVASFLPVINIFVAFFSHVFELLGKFFEFCYETLNIPLVRHKPPQFTPPKTP